MNRKKAYTMKSRILTLMTACAIGCAMTGGGAAEAGTLADAGVTPLPAYKRFTENNPLYTQRFGADPGVMEYGGRFYVYMTDDIVEYDGLGKVKENSYSQIRCINCISSADLVNWTDHGRIQVAGPMGIATWATNSWAPCAAHKIIDGREKFFLYFCNGGNGIGVLTADSPTGPWRDELGHLLITRQTPNCANVVWLFDPAVMVDEDGTGYLAFGGGVPQGQEAAPGTARIVRLTDDMLGLDCDPVVIDAPYLFEDSGINRIGDKYVYSYCSNWQTDGNTLHLTSGAIEYMVAEDPLGPYTYKGELFPNQGRYFGLYGNNHHSIGCLDGVWYLFYHNRPVEKAMGITGNYRSPQINKLPVGEDGTIGVVIGTMSGVPQRFALNPYEEVRAATMSNQAGISLRGTPGGEFCVHGQEGSWTRVSGADFGEGSHTLRIRAASRNGCHLYVVDTNLRGQILADFEIPASSAAAEYTAECALSGEKHLCFVFGGEADFYAWQAE